MLAVKRPFTRLQKDPCALQDHSACVLGIEPPTRRAFATMMTVLLCGDVGQSEMLMRRTILTGLCAGSFVLLAEQALTQAVTYKDVAGSWTCAADAPASIDSISYVIELGDARTLDGVLMMEEDVSRNTPSMTAHVNGTWSLEDNVMRWEYRTFIITELQFQDEPRPETEVLELNRVMAGRRDIWRVISAEKNRMVLEQGGYPETVCTRESVSEPE